MFKQTLDLVQSIQKNNPLILNLTNQVTMGWIANGLLSLGSSPIMTEAHQELEDLIRISNAVVINIGTLTDVFLTRCETACDIANRLNKPLIFDPVGAGASSYRTKACLNFIERFRFTAIRGNASEIMALAGAAAQTKGVDSSEATENALESALTLAEKYQTTIAVSGKIDLIVSKGQTELIERGSALMPKVTGSGCLLTAVVAAFHTVCDASLKATTSAMLFYSVCGELAAKKSQGPGSFQTHFIDALSCLPKEADYV